MSRDVFDEYARSYDEALANGLAVSGEGREFFARERVEFLATCLDKHRLETRTVLDYGCGTGGTTPLLRERLKAQRALGIDASTESIAVARERHSTNSVRFLTTREYQPEGDCDLVYCNGIFHHILPSQRPLALSEIHRALCPGGHFALWENNPWNPGTRYVMSRISFDRDAITLTALEAHRMVRTAGFRVLRTDFLFIFPHALRWFRVIEPLVSRLPLGAQYQVLCQR
ncbi:MAG: class I SAM-dependent methyltransferase [bacterium]